MIEAGEELLQGSQPKGWGPYLREIVSGNLPAALVLLALIILWELSYFVITIPKYILPAPHAVLGRLNESFPLLVRHSAVTLQETVLGFALGTVVGIILAIMITQSQLLSRTLYTLIVASQVVPKVAIAPLLVVWFGYGMLPKIVVTMLLAFFPVVIAGVTGLLATSPDTINVMRSVAASRWQVLTKVMFPNSMPYLFSGLKVAITLSVVGAIVGEWVGADAGLGYLIQIANSQLDTELMFAAFFVLLIIGLALFAVIALAERAIMPWHQTVNIAETM